MQYLSELGPRLLYGLSGLVAGSVLALYLRPPEVRTEYKFTDRVKVEKDVEYRDREQVKWREKIVEKPCGIRIIERSGSETKDTQVTDKTSLEAEKEIQYVHTEPVLPQYRIGLGVSPHAAVSPYSLENYQLMAELRLGTLPLWLGAWSKLNGSAYGLQISLEF